MAGSGLARQGARLVACVAMLGSVLVLAACAPRPALPPPQAVVAPAPPAPAPAPEIVVTGTPTQGAVLVGQAPAGTQTVLLDGRAIPLATDGRFLIGFGRDAGPQAELEARLADGTRIRRALAVITRTYDIQRIGGLPPKTVTLPAALQARRAQEVAQILAARATPSPEIGWANGFVWPAGGRISGVFGSQRIRNGVPGSPHNGLDLANPVGTPVVSPAGGVVRLAGSDYLLEGGLVIIDHGLGLYSAFLHLSRIDVAPGDHVRQGQLLGAVGATGRATGPHLHWGLRWGETFVDPALLPGLPPFPPAATMAAPGTETSPVASGS